MAGFAAAASGVWLLAQGAVRVADIPELSIGFGLADLAQVFQRIVSSDPTPNRVALIGDSTLMNANGMRKPNVQSLPGRVELSLTKYGDAGRLKIHTFRMPGLGPFGLYFASQQLVAARPDRAVLALNLRGFSREAIRGFSYVESSGWMPASQLLEALTMPLWDAGLTADRLLLYNALAAFQMDGPWRQTRQLQARAFKLYEPLARWIDKRVGAQGYDQLSAALRHTRWGRTMTDVHGRPRQGRATLERVMAPVLRGLPANHPNLRLLANVLARFRAANIPVLVYIEPFNIEYIRSQGLSLAGLPKTLRNIRRTVEGEGGELLDLHAILPERAFIDAGDHYTFEGEPNGTFLVARRLAARLARGERSPQALTSASVR